MNHIFTIIKKEILDTLRDRRTLIIMVLVPVLVFPVIFIAMTRLQMSVMERDQVRLVRIGWVNNDSDQRLADFIEAQERMELIEIEDAGILEQLIRSDSISYGLVVPEGFGSALDEMMPTTLTLYFSGAQLHGKERIDRVLEHFERDIIGERLEQMALNESFIKPFNTQPVNIASEQEMIGKLAGGFLPYLFIIFCFTGAMYPAIDLFTGEKERRTLETLLTTPVSRLQILIGKMSVVSLTGIISAILAIFGLFLGFQLTAGLPDVIMEVVMDILSIRFVLLLLLMLIPLTIFFSGVMIPLTIYAKTFKEAQSTLTPMTFLVIIPAAIAMVPGIEYNAITAMIPIINITLATKEIIAGTIYFPHYLITVVTLIGLASVSVLFCAKWFGRESNILR
jgi:sodium transport system permease protein